MEFGLIFDQNCALCEHCLGVYINVEIQMKEVAAYLREQIQCYNYNTTSCQIALRDTESTVYETPVLEHWNKGLVDSDI